MIDSTRRQWIFAGFGLAVAGLVGRLDAQPPVPPAEPATIPVKVERANGWTVEGTTTLRALRLKTDIATSDVNTARIRSLSLRTEGGVVTAAIELDDRTRLHGELIDEFLPVTVGGRVENLPSAELREVTFLKTKSGSAWALLFGLLTLAVMEVVLGIDNVIFLVIVADKLPDVQRPKARRIGLVLALGTRILLLLCLSWLIGLTRPLFTLPRLPFLEAPDARDISVRDLILLAGGLFLIWKSVKEMHEKVEAARTGHTDRPKVPGKAVSFVQTVVQIAIIDIVFSLDSVITAIGMVEELWVMIVAMTIAMLVMLAFSSVISDFVGRNPTIKVLALSFLILIGVLLVAEGLGQHMDKGYIYFAMAFAVVIELVNMRLRPKPPVDADRLA